MNDKKNRRKGKRAKERERSEPVNARDEGECKMLKTTTTTTMQNRTEDEEEEAIVNKLKSVN